MLARWGAPISRQNLCDWVGAATALLEPLVKRMKQDLLAGGYVQADETPVKCNDPDLRDGKTTTGYLWALSRPGGEVIFEWRLSRQHAEAERLLGDFTGILQSDGYTAYPDYVRTRPTVAWVGCWAHARRKFFEATGERPAEATRMLGLIAQLYQCESQWDEAQVGDERRAPARALCPTTRRAQNPRPGAVGRPGAAPVRVGPACTYLLGHWAPLTAHLQYSHTKLDTNAVENAIRPSKFGATLTSYATN